MTWQLATAKIWNGSAWVNAAGGSDVYAATDGTDAPIYTSNVLVTSSATPHTKGAWLQLVASTAFTADRINIHWSPINASGANSSALFDLGVGAAGSEVVVASDLAVGFSPDTYWDLPIRIASGSRIAVRFQSAQVSKTANCQVAISRAASTLTVAPSTSYTTWGANTATSQGVTVVPGNNVKGSWTQITADSGAARKMIGIAVQGNGNATLGGSTQKIDIGIGAAGAETVIVPNVQFTTGTTELVTLNSVYRSYFVSVPANSRLSVRSSATAVNNIDVVLFGITEVGSR